MSQSMINFRIDKDLKASMEQTCKEMGLTMTTAFTMFATKVAKEKRIPFDVCVDPFYSETNMAHLKESIIQMQQGKVISKTFDELESMENE